MKKCILSSLFVLLSTLFVNGQTFYYQSGNIDVLGSWNSAANGSGSTPASFATAGQTFNIQGVKNATMTASTTLTLGTGSTIVVGDGTSIATLDIPTGSSIAVGTVSVATLSTLKVESGVNPPFIPATFNATSSTMSTLTFDGGAQQYLPSGTYNGFVSITGANTVVTMLGAVTAGNGGSSPTGAGITVASGAKLITNNNNLTVKKGTSVVASGGTIDLGNTFTFSPYTGYNPSFASGSTIISSSTTGIDGNVSLPSTNVSTIGWFAASGINYQFTASNTNSKLLCSIVANTGSAAAGSGFTLQVNSINNALIGQTIWNGNGSVGTITAVNPSTTTLTSSASLAAIASGKNINLRNPPAVGTTSTSAQSNTGAQTFTVTSATGIVAGQCIYDNAGTFYGTVTSIASNTITAALAVAIPNNTYFNFRHPIAATFAASTTTTSNYTQGSSTNFTVTSPTSIAAGQSIVYNGLVVGTITSISSSTVTATLSTTISSGSIVAFYTTSSALSVGSVTIGTANTLNTPLTLTGALTLSGKLNSNGNNITAGSISGGSSSNYIYGVGLVTINSVPTGATTFPIGLTSTNYNPITLTGTTNTPNITVGLQNTFTHTPISTSNIVNMQWSILSTTTSNSTITFQYNSSDITGTLASPVLGTYNASYSESALGSIAGANPYTITQSAAAALGTGTAYLYGIGNPYSFISGSAPGAPTITNAVSGTGQATISFTAPAANGSAITGYTITSSPSVSLTQSSTTTSPITVTGLTNGISYTFTITATNSNGTGAGSTTSALTPGSFKYNSGNVDDVNSWVSTDGSGGIPANFTANSQSFTITGATSVNSWSGPNAVWTISGTSSAVTVGDGINAATLYIPAGNSIAGKVNVQAGSTLQVESNTNPPFTAGTFTSTSTAGAACIYDGASTQYLPAATYTGGVKVSGTNNTVILNGNITVGAGVSGSPSSASLNILTGNTLNLNGNSVTISRTSTLPSGATINFGTGSIKLTGYGITFASGCNVITSNTSGLDASLDYSSSTAAIASWFASGVNYTFNATTTTPFSTLANATQTVGATSSGATSIVVNVATNIAAGQSIYAGNGTTAIGTVVSVSGTTITTSALTVALANSAYVNFRNNASSATVASVITGTVSLGAAITANANLTATSIALSNYNFTLGSFNATTNTITNSSGFVVANSTGALTVKSVPAAATTFPVGSTASSYNPITFTGTTGSPNISVGVKNTFTNAPASTSNIVNLQWSVLSSAASNSTLSFQYNGSNVTGTLSSPILGTYNGAYAESALGAISGSNPYTVTQSAAAALGTGSAFYYGIGNPNSFVSAAAPDAPTIGTAVVNGTGSAIVSFTAPANNNGSTITSYTATSSPGNITGTISQAGSGSITVNGLTNGIAYTFKVSATNGSGTSPASGSSNAVTPGIFTYSSGNVDVLASWLDAANVNPSNFTAAGQIFNITGAVTVNSWTSNATWTVTGTGSKVVVGTGSSATILQIPAGNSIAGTVDVQTAATLKVESNALAPFTAGTFSANSSSKATVIYDGTGKQYLPIGTYSGGLTISGANDTVVLKGAVWFGAGTNSPASAYLNMASGTVLDLNGFNAVSQKSATIPSGATINFGATGTIQPYNGYPLIFASGSNVITSNANGLDASLNYSNITGTLNSFASGVNYTFNTATSKPFSTLVNATQVSGATSIGATSIVVATATNIAAGQSIYAANGTTAIGTVVSVSGTTITTSALAAALANNAYINFRNPSATVTPGSITLGASVTANASVSSAGTLTFNAGKLTLGSNNLTIGSISGASATSYIDASGTGKLTLGLAANGTTIYPVGTATSYAPITVANQSGTASNLSVSINATLANMPGDATQVANLQWSVLGSAAVNANITYQFNSADLPSGFLLNSSCEVGDYKTNYVATQCAGTGIPASLGGNAYTVSANGFSIPTSGSNYYVIGNTGNVVVTATTWTGTVSTAWATASNWTNGVPTSNVDVVIASATKSPILAASQGVKNLTVNSGASLSINSGVTLSPTLNFTNNGTISGTGTLVLGSTSVQAYTGTGTVANFTLNNSNGLSITSGNTLNITGVLTLQKGVLTTGGNVVFKSNSIASSGTLAPVGTGGNSGSISGTVTVERYIPSGYRSYRDIAPGVYNTSNTLYNTYQESGSYSKSGYGMFITGGTGVAGTTSTPNSIDANHFDVSANGVKTAYTYINGNWATVANTNVLVTPFTGYRLLIRGDRSFNLYGTGIPNTPLGLLMYNATRLEASGTLVTGNVTYDPTGVTNAVTGSTYANSTYGLNNLTDTSYSLVANPYVCPVDWSLLTKGNLSSYYYYLDPTIGTTGAYVACNAAIKPYIQAGQAFFIQNLKGAGTNPTLTFTESAKAPSSTHTAVFGSISKIAISLLREVGAGTGSYHKMDEANVVFDKSYSNGIDNEDAPKLANSNDNLSLSEGNSRGLSIDSRQPATKDNNITIQLAQVAKANYQLQVDASSYSSNGLTPYVYDAYTKTYTALNNSLNTISFAADNTVEATYVNRLSIVFKPTVLAVNSITTTATLNNSKSAATVSWSTVGEDKVVGYTVEKSTDGTVYNSIITAAANNIATASYSYVDNNVSGTTYYRIKATSTDGSIAYSNVASVTKGEASIRYSLYPNPVINSKLNLKLENVNAGKYTVSIYNSIGQKVHEEVVSHAGGTATHAIHITNTLAAGSYSVILKQEGSKQFVYQTSLSVQP
ncbi:fibronectin type III domain-containing protein [Parasediminibacterium sp. JCM 36343]|uniref:fibronectin type III domain-containing protein n=1 Tax=Parasediminibacterium sp. JCM 36343 TaxID=3374279 RepID=UPI00397A90A8